MTQKKKKGKSRTKVTPSTESMDVEFHDYIASQIRYMRKRRLLSQQGLAKKAKIDQAQVSQLENSRISPKLSTFFKIVQALDVSPTDFFQNFQMKGIESKRKTLDPVDIVSQEIAARLYSKTEKDKAVGSLWNKFLRSGGEDNDALAKLLVRVFFDPQVGKNLDHIADLPEYQRLLLGELAGEMLRNVHNVKKDDKGVTKKRGTRKNPQLTQLKEVAG